MGIKHHLVGIENYRGNARIERFIRTIRDGIFMLGGLDFGKEQKYYGIIKQYISHRLGMFPK